MPERWDQRLQALGREIRRLRRERDLSQEELGRRAGVHPNYIGRIERGAQDMRVTTLLSIVTGLDATLAEVGLPELSDEMPAASGTAPRSRSAAPTNASLVQRIDDAQKLLRDVRSAVEAGSLR
ncbi:MAG: helix-turn-helix transcriptional regulator [Conexibacter sp.]